MKTSTIFIWRNAFHVITFWIRIQKTWLRYGYSQKKGRLSEKKKMYCITFSVTHNGVSVIITRIIITVKDKPRISLVKLVVSITYPLFLAKREITFEVIIFGRSLFRGSLLLAFANTCEILSLLSGGGVSLLSKLYRKQNCIQEIHLFRNLRLIKF